MAEHFDELMHKLSGAGWLVTDCYQTAAKRWTIALKNNLNHARAYGQGETALQALEKAMSFYKPKTKRVPLIK